jgi:hypothetical protein
MSHWLKIHSIVERNHFCGERDRGKNIRAEKWRDCDIGLGACPGVALKETGGHEEKRSLRGIAILAVLMPLLIEAQNLIMKIS